MANRRLNVANESIPEINIHDSVPPSSPDLGQGHAVEPIGRQRKAPVRRDVSSMSSAEKVSGAVRNLDNVFKRFALTPEEQSRALRGFIAIYGLETKPAT